jgi:hypothetical protein
LNVVLAIIWLAVLNSGSEVAWILIDEDKYTLNESYKSKYNNKQHTRSTRPQSQSTPSNTKIQTSRHKNIRKLGIMKKESKPNLQHSEHTNHERSSSTNALI